MADPVEVYHVSVASVVADSIEVTIVVDLVVGEVDIVAVIEEEEEVMHRERVTFPSRASYANQISRY